jgi:excisionase family DNA binding protein
VAAPTQHCCADGGLDVRSLRDNASMFNDETLRLLSPTDVARLLGVCRATAYRRIHSGEIPALRLGETGPLRVRSDQLERWLAAHPVTPKEEEHGRAA